MANSVDPDETLRSAASHLGPYCLLRPSVRIYMVNMVHYMYKQLTRALLQTIHLKVGKMKTDDIWFIYA